MTAATNTASFLENLEKALREVPLPEEITFLDDDRLLHLRPHATSGGYYASFVCFLWKPHADSVRLWYKPIVMNLRTVRSAYRPHPEDVLDWVKTEVGLISKRFAVEIERGAARITTDGGEIEIREAEDTLHYAGSRF